MQQDLEGVSAGEVWAEWICFPVSAHNLLLHSHSCLQYGGQEGSSPVCLQGGAWLRAVLHRWDCLWKWWVRLWASQQKGKRGKKMWAVVFPETSHFCLKEKADPWEIAGLYLALVMDLVSFARRKYKCVAQMLFYPDYHFYNKIYWSQAFFPQHFSFDVCL